MLHTEILFFDEDIEINVHTATKRRNVGKTLTIRQFAKKHPCRLYRTDEGDFIAEKVFLNQWGRWEEFEFIQGPPIEA